MAELLQIDNLSAGYGEAVVLTGISLQLGEGRTLALLGRNGTGKTTLINTLAGATRQHGGSISLAGLALHKLAPHQRAAAGIGWVPQERNIFKSLTVHENLTAVERPGRWNPQRVYEMFPRLSERKGNRGTQLSGGEQQMLAVGRALVGRQLVQGLPTERDGSAVLPRGPRQRVDQRGLARAVAAQQRQRLAFAEREGHVVQHHGLAVAGAQVLDAQQFRHERRLHGPDRPLSPSDRWRSFRGRPRSATSR